MGRLSSSTSDAGLKLGEEPKKLENHCHGSGDESDTLEHGRYCGAARRQPATQETGTIQKTHRRNFKLRHSPPRLVPIGLHLGAPAHGAVGTGPCPSHCCRDDDPSRSMLYERTVHPFTLGTGIAL